MSALPSFSPDDGQRLARLEAIVTERGERSDELHALHRQELAATETRLMGQIEASERRTSGRIDAAVGRVDTIGTKIDGLAAALTKPTGRPADTESTDSGAFRVSASGRLSPKIVGAILAALTGAGLVGGAVNAQLQRDSAPTVTVTTAAP